MLTLTDSRASRTFPWGHRHRHPVQKGLVPFLSQWVGFKAQQIARYRRPQWKNFYLPSNPGKVGVKHLFSSSFCIIFSWVSSAFCSVLVLGSVCDWWSQQRQTEAASKFPWLNFTKLVLQFPQRPTPVRWFEMQNEKLAGTSASVHLTVTQYLWIYRKGPFLITWNPFPWIIFHEAVADGIMRPWVSLALLTLSAPSWPNG